MQNLCAWESTETRNNNVYPIVTVPMWDGNELLWEYNKINRFLFRITLQGRASTFCQLNSFSSECEHAGSCKLPAERGVKARSRAQADLHSDFRELLLGEVQRMVYSSDPVFLRVLASPQISSEDCIVGYIEETNHGMPAFIVKPHLKETEITD